MALDASKALSNESPPIFSRVMVDRGVLSFFIALIACNTANGATGIGRPRLAFGLLIGAPET